MGQVQYLSGLYCLIEGQAQSLPGHTNDGIVLKYGDEFTTSVVPLHGDVHHTRPRVVRRIKWDKTCLSDCQKFTQKAKGMKCISAGRSRLQSEL